jgi:hypothetical protein
VVAEQGKQERKLLILSKPPKPPNQMDDRELDQWADQIFLALKAQVERTTGRDIPAPEPEA